MSAMPTVVHTTSVECESCGAGVVFDCSSLEAKLEAEKLLNRADVAIFCGECGASE